MRNATTRALAGMSAAALFLAAQTALAQQTNGCPAGQAMQSSDPSGKRITCVPIPDVSGLQGQISGEATARATADTQLQSAINAETAARTAGDAQLQGAVAAEAAARGAADAQLQSAINAEAAARMAADGAEAASRIGMDATLLQAINDEAAARNAAIGDLRNAVIESSIVGTYAFSGPVVCLNSSNGFNDDRTPKAATSPTASTVISQLSGITHGTRTFNADGTGTVDVTTQSILTPSIFYTSTNGVGIGFNVAPPNPSGGVNVSVQSASFTWQIVDGNKLVITEDTISGTFTDGNRIGWSIVNSNLPKAVGILGKDLRTITLTTQDVQVETTLQTPPPGQPGTPSSNFRICGRHRVLTKL